jgi:hypothetical protein
LLTRENISGVEFRAIGGGLGEVVDCEDGVGIEQLMKQNRKAVIE